MQRPLIFPACLVRTLEKSLLSTTFYRQPWISQHSRAIRWRDHSGDESFGTDHKVKNNKRWAKRYSEVPQPCGFGYSRKYLQPHLTKWRGKGKSNWDVFLFECIKQGEQAFSEQVNVRKGSSENKRSHWVNIQAMICFLLFFANIGSYWSL